MAKTRTIKDTYGRVINKGDNCLFWNDNPKARVEYQFYDWYDRPSAINKIEHHYISIDKDDNDDLSYWKNCEKIVKSTKASA